MRASRFCWLLVGLIGVSVFSVQGAGPPAVLGTNPKAFRDVRILKAYRKSVESLCFSHDGRTMAVAGDKSVQIWDCRTWIKLSEARLDGDYLAFAFFAKDDRTIVCSGGARTAITLLDVPSLKKRTTFDLSGKYAVKAAISPDGKSIAVGLIGSFRIYDLATAKKTMEVLFQPTDSLKYLSFAPDGKTIAVIANGKNVQQYRVKDGKELRRLSTGDVAASFERLALSPQANLVAAGSWARNMICLWDADTGKVRRELRWGGQFPIDRGLTEKDLDTLRTQKRGLDGLAFSHDGKTLAAACSDGKLRLWEVSTGGLRHQVELRAWRLAFSPCGKMLATGRWDEGSIWLWDWRTPGRQSQGRLTQEALDRAWRELAAEDARVAYSAMARLLTVPNQAVEMLGKRLRRVESVNDQSLERLLVDLNADTAAKRERAFDRLAGLGKAAERKLRATLANTPSAEVQRRIRRLLDRFERIEGEQLRVFRSIEVLESVYAVDAERIIRYFASGADAAEETDDAKGALKRMSLTKSRSN